jgi:iron complex transport system ATP-binding protein
MAATHHFMGVILPGTTDVGRAPCAALPGDLMLRVTDVVAGYGAVRVLHRVSLEIPGDGFVGILGPNGSGKTTLLRVLAGTLTPGAGRVALDDVPLTRLSRTELARRMAVVPQETHLAFDFTVMEVVLMGRYPHLGTFEVEGPVDLAIAREALAATGTQDLELRPFATLSGGEKQRVVIAAALAQISRPAPRAGHEAARGSSVLLLDEPTAALDLAYQLEIARLVRDLQKRLRIAIVVSTHDLNFAAALCRTLVLLKDGGVLATGPTDDVLTPSHIRALYGVEADVQRHGAAGHLIVVPIQRLPVGSPR